MARCRREKCLGLRPAARESALQPAFVLVSAVGAGDLFANEGPEALSTGIKLLERHPIEAAGAVSARHHPPIVCKRLEMAADSGLWELQHRADLGHGEFVPLERQQHPAADGVGERGHVVENRSGVHIHPSIRIKGIIATGLGAVKSRERDRGQGGGGGLAP